ncbi:MAG: valine--tRNA ligase [Bdellovibrionales bacterium]|nr:valine--tRNA ligase [Bdellovibrionales bacterium]
MATKPARAAKKNVRKAAPQKAPARSAPRRPSAPALALPPRELTGSFEPAKFEASLYEFWEKSGCFDAADESAPGQKSFCIMIPPPNVTGHLHMGHALTNAIQDTLIRWRRMSGDNTLYQPGTDHAGIATQLMVERALADEGRKAGGRPITRHDLGREKFLERTWKWKEDHAHIITGQLRRLGCSFDWKRERFTLDDGLSRAVREVFVRLYKDGLIYRGERIINWDTVSQSAVSDLEVVPTERKGFLWHIKYAVVESDGTPVAGADGKEAFLTIATTRPETLLGDTAVAVHPEDDRYSAFHGKHAKLPLLGRVIPILTDTYVEREFGTGALKITPAHDFNDYEIGKRHNLPLVSVMGKDGKITAAGGPYAAMDFKTARERIIADLKESGRLEKTEEHTHKVGLCDRTGQPAEPLVSKQWFVKIEPLAKPAIAAVESGKIEFSPKSWEKTYFEWMYNIRDWCISRQLWWGHRVPAWYCSTCQEITVAVEAPAACGSCGADADRLKQDEDVLDTWFSSGLWPFSTLGWPEKTPALNTFYPTSILETGFDIIFFWVARMIMMGLHFTGDVPFRKVYLHAMVRDEKGEKMSKTKGNVIDPLDVMAEHGADALRFTLLAMAGQGRDIKLSLDRVAGYRGFCNKLWNATKFFHLQVAQGAVAEPQGGAESWLLKNKVELLPVNRWVLSRLQQVNGAVTKGLEEFRLNEAAQAIYDFSWHELCDWYIEFSKVSFKEGGEARKQTLITLHYVLERLLRMMHPFMPFVTEELWLSLPWKKPANSPTRERDGAPAVMSLMLQKYPQPEPRFANSEAEKTVAALQGIIEALRNFRGENRIPTSKEIAACYVAPRTATDAFVQLFRSDIMAMARLSALEKAPVNGNGGAPRTIAVIPVTNPALELHVDLKGLVDVEEETKRLRKEIERVQGDLSFIRGKLTNESFVAKAPKELVAKEKGRENELVGKLRELESALTRLSG